MARAQKFVKVGLGEALRRLLDLEIRMRHGLSSPDLTKERGMILDALNKVEINLGFDCDGDGLPETIELFRESAETSCCRLVDLPGTAPTRQASKDSSRLQEAPPKPTSEVAKTPEKAVAKAVAPSGVFGGLFNQGKKKP